MCVSWIRYALRVFLADTRLTVYRRCQVGGSKRVIRRHCWASLNFSVNGHFCWNDHHTEKFEKCDNSRDSSIIFPYTYGYAGAACLTLRGWRPFFESKKHRPLSDTWVSKNHQHMNFHEIQVWPYQNDREASAIIFLAARASGRYQK